MRVSQLHLQSLVQRSVSDSRANLVEKQKIAASGQRLTVPSDDPDGSSRARLLTGLLAETEAYSDNISFGESRLNRAEDAMAESENILVRIKELAYANSTGTASAEQRNLAATEVDQLRDNLIDLANTRQGQEYIFANMDTSTPPVASDGTVTWDASSGVRVVEIGPAKTGEISASAQGAFNDGINVFDVLEDLAVDLRSNDPDAIRANLDDIETAFGQVLSERVKVGVRTNRIRAAEINTDQTRNLYKTLRSNIVDADAAEAFSDLSLAQTSLQAAITVSARVFGPSLLDSM